MSLPDDLKTFYEEGAVIVPNVLESMEASLLREELQSAMEEDLHERPDVFDCGMVHNCMIRGREMAKLLDNEIMNRYVCGILGATSILYAYQSSSLLPHGNTNYGHRLHVDSPRFIPGYITNIGVIFPLDDFTEENGATEYLKGSHLSDDIPTEEYFGEHFTQALCHAGDMLVFNARVFHRSGINRSGRTRHALTLNFCRSYMRQRFDYPRLVSKPLIDVLGENGKRLLGLNVRMPTSLDEFYLPDEERLYKANQG